MYDKRIFIQSSSQFLIIFSASSFLFNLIGINLEVILFFSDSSYLPNLGTTVTKIRFPHPVSAGGKNLKKHATVMVKLDKVYQLLNKVMECMLKISSICVYTNTVQNH